jgi:hypothetical protein
VASGYEYEGQSPDEGTDSYYAELRFAVHGQSRSIPLPRTALDDQETDTPRPPRR